VLLRRRLWNGNRESLSDVLSGDPERSVVVWSWTRHEAQRQRYGPQADHRGVRRTSRSDVQRFLRTLEAPRDAQPCSA